MFGHDEISEAYIMSEEHAENLEKVRGGRVMTVEEWKRKNPPIQRRPTTNGDLLRSMSDEELAEWFVKVQDDIADYYDKGHSIAPEMPTFKESWLDWLRQEAFDA